VNKEIEPPSADGAAPSDQSKRSGYCDLQYVSLELDGKTYGGWYRQLPDGQLELLAIGNIRSERRSNGTAMDQARGMLEEFVRAARSNGLSEHESRDVSTSSGGSGEAKAQAQAQSTLGDLLYCDKTKSRVPEDDWIGLVRLIAVGDKRALDQLFDRTHRIVFTLMMRLIGNRDAAEELTLDVFQDVWRQAAHFDAAGGPVLAWLLDQARLRAIERLEFERSAESDAAGAREQAVQLRNAAAALSCHERQLIDGTYFSSLSYRELAARRQQPTQSVIAGLHSGMEKLREQLDAQVERQ
jgi:RNA polymerase sigma-70 factor (ECF subfamily)